MKTLDLRKERVTLEQLLHWATAGTVRILAKDGHEFILEEAELFDREVEMLGQSEKFMNFLKERSQETSVISLDEFEKSLEE